MEVNYRQFKPFGETYRYITFALSIGMIYPNPKTDVYRILAIPAVVVTIAPIVTLVLIDMYFCWIRRDIVNIIRHSTVVGPFVFSFFKMILMYYRRKEAAEILVEINRDYNSYNQMSEEHKELALRNIRDTRVYVERSWVIMVFIAAMIFPIMSIALNLYNFTFKSEPVKYMIHDLKLPFSEPEDRFKSPQFEVMFAYMFYCSILAFIYFVAYDGLFGLAINHACMKMDLFRMDLEDAIRNDREHIHERIVKVIQDQCKMFRFVDLIQDTFNIWLGLIFVATIIQICTSMYYIAEGYGFDIKHVIYGAGAVVHIYLPCRYVAKLKAMSIEASTKIYCCGWENVYDQKIRKMVLFMLTRGHTPIQITAFNMVAFDMELFTFMMETSYSMYTLLRS